MGLILLLSESLFILFGLIILFASAGFVSRTNHHKVWKRYDSMLAMVDPMLLFLYPPHWVFGFVWGGFYIMLAAIAFMLGFSLSAGVPCVLLILSYFGMTALIPVWFWAVFMSEHRRFGLATMMIMSCATFVFIFTSLFFRESVLWVISGFASIAYLAWLLYADFIFMIIVFSSYNHTYFD